MSYQSQSGGSASFSRPVVVPTANKDQYGLEAGVAIDGARPVAEEASGLFYAKACAHDRAGRARREAASNRGDDGLLTQRLVKARN